MYNVYVYEKTWPAPSRRIKKRKRENTQKLLRRVFCLFVSFANNLLPSEEECKDVVHDVFLKYWNTRNDFDNLIAIRAFFYKSIRNTCLNLIRHQQVQNKYLAENLQYLESESFIHETVVKEEIFHVIHQEISHLTEMEQKVLLLTLEEKSNEEIAQELGIAVSTVKSHKAKGYAVLREKLQYIKNIITFTFLIFNNISFFFKKNHFLTSTQTLRACFFIWK